MKKRVLFLHQNAALGGAELYLVEVAKHFRESSMVVLFGDGPLRVRLEEAGVKVLIAATGWAQEGVRGGKPRLNAKGATAITKLAVRMAVIARGYDVLFANSPKALTIASLAGVLARRPVLWAFHDLLDPSHFSRDAMRQMATFAKWGADRIVACSAAGAASLIREGGRAERVYVVYQGIDPANFREGELNGLRGGLGLGRGPIAGVFGRITHWKGQHVPIELLGRFPDLNLLIVGEAEEESYADGLRQRAAELKAAGRLRILGHRRDIPDLMRLADMVLHTSVAPEPFGRVVVEAMLAGRPVIAATGGGVGEIIEDGVSGVLVPRGDVDALAAAVAGLLGDPGRSREMAAAGYERARTLFTPERMLSALERHLAEVAR